MGLRVLLVDIGSKRSAELARLLADLDFSVVGTICNTEDLYDCLPKLKPDVVVIASDSPRRDTLEHLAGMHSRHPRPMMMLSQEGGPHLTRNAAQAGINAYVVEGLSAPLVRSLIEVTMLGFLNQEALRAELDTSKQNLSDYKTVNKAKAHIIQHLKLSEAEAHGQLRRMSQDQRKSLVAIARQVLKGRPMD